MQEVLIVAHGSRNGGWTRAVEAWFAEVRELVGGAADLSLSYLEITAPSYEQRLEELANGPGELLIFPFFLTRSGHGGEDVPEGASKVLDGRRPWRLIETRGWTETLGVNAFRRLIARGVEPETPVIVCGYGASHGDEEWLALVREIQKNAGPFAGDAPWRWAPCGHFLDDYAAPLRAELGALDEGRSPAAAVLPLFLARSSYQEKLIPNTIDEFPRLEIVHTADSILPDSGLARWAAEAIIGAASEIHERALT